MNCLDTYALIEIHKGNPNYSDIINDDFIVPDLIMAEYYGYLFRKYDEKTADYWHRKLAIFCKSVPMEILILAVKFRILHKSQNLSFFDCVGYIYSQENKLTFVTGDKEFKDLKGVNFIK